MSLLQLTNVFPKEGVTNASCQRYAPSRVTGANKMPVLFVPTTADKPEEGEVTTVKVYITKDISKVIKVFKDGDVEDLLQLQQRHEMIIGARKLQEKHTADTATLNGERARLGLMDADDEERVELVAQIATLEQNLTGYVQSAFDYFEQLLDESLHNDWNTVVTDVTTATTYTDNNGVEHANVAARGKNFETLKVCYLRIIRWATTQNAAELLRTYMQTCIKMPKKGLNVSQYISRFLVLNNYLEMLPCLKQIQGSPANLARADVKFTDIELCPMILSGMDTPLALAYHALKGRDHFATSVKQLKEDLESIEPSVALSKETTFKEGMSSKSGGSKPAKSGNGKGYNKKARMSSRDEKIPRKSSTPKSDETQEKLCQKCAKWSPEVKNTHNTSECFKWNKDGSKGRRNNKGKYASNNVSAHQMGEMVSMFQAFSKAKSTDSKKRKARKNKKRKHVRDSRYLSSDDDTMDSDSS